VFCGGGGGGGGGGSSLVSHSKRGAQLAQACWRYVSIGQQFSACGALCEEPSELPNTAAASAAQITGSLAYDTGRQTRHSAVYFTPAGSRAATCTQVCC